MPIVTLLALVASPLAEAHISLVSPAKRYDAQKSGPCGNGTGDARTDTVTVYRPGETITVEWVETINHPSHYRIAFDADGADDFVDPQTMYEFYSNDAVLLDEIPDDPSGSFSVQVTLPNVECENCTLQVVQVMYDKPPYVPGTNDLYYQCADLALRGEPVTTTPPTGTTGTTGTDDTGPVADDDDTGLGGGEEKGCGCASPPASAAGWLAGAAAILERRRR